MGFDFRLLLLLSLAVEVVEKKVDVEQDNELVLDGGFVVPEKKVDDGKGDELVLDSGFVVPDSNAFGHTFR